MIKYDSYKDIGVEWIGEIPNNWETFKLKYLFTEKKSTKNPLLSSGSISFGEVIYKDDEKIPVSTKESYQEVLSGEFLVNPLNLNYDLKSLRIGKSEIDVVVSQGYIVLILLGGNNPKYFKYFLRDFDIKHMKSLGQGIRQTISFTHLKDELLVKPSLQEQQQIGEFLDTKTTLIDSLIEKTQRKIELLKEQRTSLINQVVTKGLNPNVEMKYSGVEWIGEIPNHWGITKIKYTGKDSKDSFIDGDWIESKDISDSGIKYITSGNIGQGFYKEQGKGFITEETFNRLNCLELYEGDLIISRLFLPVGRSCILPNLNNRVITCVDNVLLRPKPEYSKRFLNYQFNSVKYNEFTELISRGVTLTRISRSMLGNNQIVIPNLKEQQQIVDYLDEKTEQIDSTITNEKKRIKLLKEYRQSLISEVVTGKIKVTNE